MSEEFIYSQKNNFAGGELTPTIEGRTELGLYQNGARKLINFMILPSGGIMRRPGTRFIHLFDTSVLDTGVFDVPKKMVNVMFSRDLSYLLVFEAHDLKTTCSFFVGGELFVSTVTLKHNDRDFHFKPKDFSYVCYQGMAYISFGSGRPIYRFSVDIEIVDAFYQYIRQRARERQEEQGDRPEIAIEEEFNDAASFDRIDDMFVIEPFCAKVNYFKTLENEERPFNEVIYNAEIDGINDELRTLHEDSDTNIYEHVEEELYASHVVAFENRLWCFGRKDNIHGIWASYKGDFSDFRTAYKTLLEARNPLTAFSSTFSSATFDNVLWTTPFSSELLIGTTDGIYLAQEGDRAKGEFIKIHKEIDIPVSPIKPVIIGKSVFFVEGDGGKINSLYYSREKGGWQISPVTHLAEHIFSCGIRQLVGSNTPFSILFAVLKNGSFASFTYLEDLKIMGWAQHWLGGNGFVLSMTPVYAKGEDRLYLHVRRSDDNGTGLKEYLEVLHTKYFTAKTFEMGKVVYADCHVNVKRAGEHVLYNNVINSIEDDTAYEFRGSLTRLEEIIQNQAEIVARLDIDNINIGQNFKYDNRIIDDYPEHLAIKDFLTRYYQEYQPKIMEILAASFGFYRLIGRIYAGLESIFCSTSVGDNGDNIEDLSNLNKLLYDAERLGGDVIHAIEEEVQNWNVPEILRQGGIMEYIANDAFSFNPRICNSLKDFDMQIIRNIFDMAKRVFALVEENYELHLEKSRELAEMISSVAVLNKKMLLYFAGKDNDNREDLDLSIKKFFQQKGIDFYSSLKDISHSTLSRYLYSDFIKNWLDGQTSLLGQEVEQEELAEQARNIINGLIGKLEEKHTDDRMDEIASFKRRSEIRDILIDAFMRQDLNAGAKEYVQSDALKELIDEVVDIYELGIAGSESSSDEESSDNSSSSDDSSNSSEVENKVNIAIYNMQELVTELGSLKKTLLEYADLIITNESKCVLDNIIADEKNIKLEKYLLLSKKYFPVFKKMFPDIGSYEMSVIARSCMNSFSNIRLAAILPIYQKMAVSIIGDEELHAVRILDNDLIRLKSPVRFLSIGFGYKSILKTFPFIYPDEYEHAPKADVELGVKLFNTKGGYMQEKLENGEIEQQHVNSRYVDSDALTRFSDERKYLYTKAVCNVLAAPYRSGWASFVSRGMTGLDNDFTFIVDKPYPASILKIYAKAKILPHYKQV